MLYIGSGLAVLAIVTIVSFLLIRERANVAQSASRSADNILQLIDTDVQRNADLYDLSLKGLIEASQHPDFVQIPQSLRRRVLFDRAITGPFRGDILWVDRQGNIVGDSLASPPRQANFADDHDFQKHRDDPSSALLISQPFKDRIGSLGWCIAFSRRISSPDGKFLGVASGALRLAYFEDLFKGLNIGRDSTLNLLNTAGIVLARQPMLGNVDLIGQDFSQKANFIRILKQGSGSFTSVSSMDHKERLYTFSRVGELPLIVIIAMSTDVVYASWQRTAMIVSIATGLLCIGILWLSLMLGRELRLRQSAERNLAALAATDSLTGLANRRSLDLTLRREWSRALRGGKVLSVLMIDVDHFKAFNERHGHQGGDEALREVAKAIRQSIHRPADLAARYGGEEFLVMLAETDLNGALIIAESIRHAVQMQPPYAGDEQPVTVSIGVASQTPGAGAVLGDLLGAADTALYQAKAGGRNQVGFNES
ncbi:GGDEF domain-containing protein [Pseudomonas abieticivorans]|uniref:GGDEF domain-containing protein n=1 Tax=Pseudomonas abieticivorans TaxID=2931382 RepID=UPI0020C0868D|nr:sensor domain-containing diguanylate cyclase [Pseudomonas sp. PIA16]